MGQLGLVQRHNHAEDADAETRDGTAGIQVRQCLGPGLQSAAEAEDESSDQDGPATTELVTHGTGGGGTKKGTAREDGHDCCSEMDVVRPEAARYVWEGVHSLLIVGGTELGLEGLAGNDLGNDTEIVTKQERAERGEDADQELV
jgi:hypothetical protein